MPQMNIKDLATKGMVYVEKSSQFTSDCARAMAAWKEFCALPQERKILFPYSGDLNASGNGYELKKKPNLNASEKIYDAKENFHLRTCVRDWLLFHAQKVDPVITREFIHAALALSQTVAGNISRFVKVAEREYDMPGFAEEVMSAQSTWLIRFLHYFGNRKPGEIIAKDHNDKGLFTIHLDETASGVEQLTYDSREWESMDVSPARSVIFPGMGLQNRSQCRVRALCHRVVATEKTAQQGRFSSVVFISMNNARYFNKVAFGSQQKWPPGFFYDIPFEEFDTYFVS